MVRWILALLVCLVPLAAVAQETDPEPVPQLRPMIDQPQREGDEVRLQGTAPPGVRVVARIGGQSFETVADEYGRWWLKFTPGGAREAIVVIGKDASSTVVLPRTEVEVTVRADDVTGPQIAVGGVAPDHLVISLYAGAERFARTQPSAGRWRVEAEAPDGAPALSVVATEADGGEVFRRDVALEWPRHQLTVTYPQEGRIAVPFGVRGTTTAGAVVRVGYGESVVETVANEDGKFGLSVPPPPRGPVELVVEAGPGTDRAVRQTVRLQVINTLEAPVGRIVGGAAIGTVLGLGLGAGFGYWMGDLLYSCTNNCAIDVEDVQIWSAIYGATWGAASLGPTAMHMLSHAGGYNGSYATAAGISAAATLLVWGLGAYFLALVQPTDIALYSAIVAGAGGVVATGLSAWGYTVRGDQTRRKVNSRRSSLRVRPAGLGLVGSW